MIHLRDLFAAWLVLHAIPITEPLPPFIIPNPPRCLVRPR